MNEKSIEITPKKAKNIVANLANFEKKKSKQYWEQWPLIELEEIVIETKLKINKISIGIEDAKIKVIGNRKYNQENPDLATIKFSAANEYNVKQLQYIVDNWKAIVTR